MKWEEVEKDREYKLVDEAIPFRCGIRKMTGMDSWTVNTSLFGTQMIDAYSADEAKWRATLMVYDDCNRKANYYHKIRDHLPDVHDLARDAGI